jgi:dipeptidyl aminopeptidase/acylaminoacyl peptidase
LRAREYPGGQIQIRWALAQTAAFSQYYIDYPSDGLTITGVMYVPAGEGPFPTLILLHGYIDRERYFSGADTWQAAEFFAAQGYLVIAPDLRSWGEADVGLSLFHTGLTADAINLIASLHTLPEVAPKRIGLWGHSMGGGIATKVLVVAGHQVDAAVLYAPNSADDSDLISRWGRGCLPGESGGAEVQCNPAEVIPDNTSPELVEAYITQAQNPDFLRQVAPLYYLDSITTPLQIHIGTADGEFLPETPPEWSNKLTEALRTAGKEVDYYLYPEQGHAFVGESWARFLERSLIFFDDHLK